MGFHAGLILNAISAATPKPEAAIRAFVFLRQPAVVVPVLF
jgi:hypothetical protein